jgi:2-dehydropantoate 2-reductase
MHRPSRTKNTDVDFAILGAGAIGSILGAHLARAGHSVVMLARDRRAKQIQNNGLWITGLAELSERVPTLPDGEELRSARVLIVAMKTPGTAEALAALRHVDVGAAFSIQNGPLKNELLAGVFGEPRVLGALANTSGEMLPSGEIAFTRNVAILLGDLFGAAKPRAEHIARTIDASGVRAAAVVNIQSLEWSKFVAWAGLMALSVTTRVETWRFLTDSGSALVLVRLVREMAILARALGVELTDESVLPVATISAGTERDAIAAVIKVGHDFELNARTHRMSSLQDLEAGRPLEIHETFGFALQEAASRQLPLPLVEAFYHLIAAIDGIRLSPPPG